MRKSPQAPCTAPNQSVRLKTYYFPNYPPILWELPAQNYPLGVEIVHPRKHAQTYFFSRHPDPNRYMLLYPPPKHPGCQLTLPVVILQTSPCNIFAPLFHLSLFSAKRRQRTHNAPACSLLLDVSNFADSRTGLCQQCLGHNVAELEAEKEVDTRVHADAEENDEKRESFEDLPEHLRLGTEFTLRVTVLQVQSSPMKSSTPGSQTRQTADLNLQSSGKAHRWIQHLHHDEIMM